MSPPQEEYYIGVDVGTGSARACIIDAAGEIKALASRAIKTWQPRTGYYEQSTTDIWNRICECVRQVVLDSKVDPAAVQGLGFDATCSLAVFATDGADKPEPVTITGPDFANDGNDRNVVLWLDHRAGDETDLINATSHNLLRYVGGSMSIEMEMPKVLWLKKNMPADRFGRCSFYDLADALTRLATGRETRSFCSTVCKQGYVPVGVDGSVGGWQGDFLRAVGLGELAEDDFARIGGVDKVNGQFLSAGELIGNLSDRAARELGLPASVRVGSGVIDAYAGWIGTVGAKVELGAVAGVDAAAGDLSQALTRLAAVAGTSTCHLAMSRDPVFVPGVWGPYRDVVLPGYWMAEGGQSATGELMRHVVETHPGHGRLVELARDAGENVYDHLNGRLRALAEERASPFLGHVARHLFFYGDLWGNRSPVADSAMRGAVVGLDSNTGVDALALAYYVAMEFIALQTRQIVEAMNRSGHNIGSIFMSGSQCANPVLMDLLATACDLPVVIPEYAGSAVVHGAALLGALAAGGGSGAANNSLWQIMDKMSRPGRVVRPGTSEPARALLAAKYEVFLDLCERQRTYRAKVDDAMRKFEA